MTTWSLVMGVSSTFPDFDFALMTSPPCHLRRNFALRRVRDFARVAKALAPFALTLASLKMINTLLVLHPLDSHSLFLDSLLDF